MSYSSDENSDDESEDGAQNPPQPVPRRGYNRPRNLPGANLQPPVVANNQAPVQPQPRMRIGARQGVPAPNVAAWNQPANNVPVQPVVQPVVQQPPQLDPNAVNTKTLDKLDTIPQRQRRWTVNTMTLLGLRSQDAQSRILGSSIATTARIDESFCRAGQPNDAAALRGTFQAGQLNGDPALTGMLNQLAMFEQHAPGHGVGPRTAQNINPLRQAAGQLEQSLAQNPDPAKGVALQAVKDKLRPYDLRDQIVAFGNPPWKPEQAAQAAKAKVELDLLSLPANARVAEANGAGGVNASYWINRSGGTGNDQKSFLCKPPAAASEVDGVPDGGEVAREALVHRAAEFFGAKLGVDMKFPETHSLALDSSFFPANTFPANTKVACSVQEARPNQGGTKAATKTQLAQVPTEQVHALAILDMATLNVDRHGDNLMLSGTDLIPIDHGGSLPDPTPRGLARVENAMGSGHNALLTLPQAHLPLSNEMLATLKELKPSAVAKQLKAERNKINAETGSADPNLAAGAVLSDGAIDSSARAMEFMQFAAKTAPGVSPAVLQATLAANAKVLLDPALKDKQFKALATRALNEAIADAPVLKEACLLNKVEKKLVKERIGALGWSLGRQGAPSPNISNNQVLALKIVANGIAFTDPVPPNGANQPRLAAPVPAAGMPKPQQIAEMAQEYPSLKNQAFITGRRLQMDEEWAAFQALAKIKDKTPEEFEEVASFAMVTPLAVRVPTAVLRAIHQLRAARVQIAQAEALAGGREAGVQASLLNLKVAAATRSIALIQGPLNATMTQALQLAQNGNNVMAQVTRTSEAAYELVRTNLRAEVGEMRTQNQMTAQVAKPILDSINDGAIEDASQDIAAHKGPLNLPRRVFV